MKYKCLVLDHDDTVVDSTASIHYPAFLEAAEEEKLDAAAAIFRRAMKAEECHAKNYQNYLDNLDKIEDADIYLCPTCGYIKIGDNSGACPVCMVSCAAFKKY